MHSGTKLPQKHMYIILVSLSVIMLSLSVETMMRVKDISIFNTWYELQHDISREAAFDVFVTANLAMFIQRVIVPMMFGLHSYFAYTKIRINKLFVFMWTVLLGGHMIYTIISFQYNSLFYYINVLIYIVLIITTLSLLKVINENKGL